MNGDDERHVASIVSGQKVIRRLRFEIVGDRGFDGRRILPSIQFDEVLVWAKESTIIIHRAVSLEERGFGENLMEKVHLLYLVFL